MKCMECGAPTETATTLDQPICRRCAEEKGFPLCTELGKYIADDSFSCSYICDGCVYRKIE